MTPRRPVLPTTARGWGDARASASGLGAARQARWAAWLRRWPSLRDRFQRVEPGAIPRPSSPGLIRPSQTGIDRVLCGTVLSLAAFGSVMVFSSGAVFAARRYGDAFYFLKRELVYALGGLVAFAVAVRLDYRLYRRIAYPLLFVCLIMLVAVLEVGSRVGGAIRWFHLGPLSLQPGELAKFALCVYLATLLARKAEKIRDFSVGFLPPLVVTAVMMGLLLKQPDLGTAVIFGCVALGLLFVAGTRTNYLVLALLVAAPAGWTFIVSTPFRMRRMLAFLDPWAFRRNVGYQITESLISVGSGGVSGLGLGDGRQKLFFLPEAHTDFILSIVGEELGLVGIGAVIAAFAVLVWRGLRAASRARDPFGSYLAFGITAMFGLQALVNIGVVLGSLPTKGLPLPFISFGGTSLVVSLFMAGVLANISRAVPGAPRPALVEAAAPPPPAAATSAASGARGSSSTSARRRDANPSRTSPRARRRRWRGWRRRRRRAPWRRRSPPKRPRIDEMRLLIAGGGTGGHLYPGIAIAEEVMARPRGEVLFVGTARGLETRLVPAAGYPLELLDVSGLNRVGAAAMVRGLARLPRALARSREILRRFRPDVVLGVGGYASGPMVLAAALLRYPTAIQEQNSLPGVTNRLLGRCVRRVFIAFEQARPFFAAAKVSSFGNPVRRRFVTGAAAGKDGAGATSPAAALPRERSAHEVLILGGSQGARAVNDLVVGAVAALRASPSFVGLHVVHQSGHADEARVRQRYAELALPPDTVEVRPFIDDMPAALGRASLVIARAGALTLAELAIVGRPTILIPLPTAASDHQSLNAAELARAGAALVLDQRTCTPVSLAGAMTDLIGDPARAGEMAAAMARLGRPAATREIVDALERLATGTP